MSFPKMENIPPMPTQSWRSNSIYLFQKIQQIDKEIDDVVAKKDAFHADEYYRLVDNLRLIRDQLYSNYMASLLKELEPPAPRAFVEVQTDDSLKNKSKMMPFWIYIIIVIFVLAILIYSLT